MPFKLILTLVLVAFVAVFTGFNLDNSCNVWLFYTFKDVPVFVTILISLVAGVVITLPFTLGKRVKQVEKEEKEKRFRKMEKEEKKAQKAAKKAAAKASKNTSVPAGDSDEQKNAAVAETVAVQTVSAPVSPADAMASASTADPDPESAQ